MTDLVLSSDRAAARKYHESWHYRLPEKFRDVRSAEEVPSASPASIGGADPFIASIYNGHHGTALRRIR